MNKKTGQAGGLPIWKLLAFTVAGFLTIMTETMPAGLLPQIGAGLDVSESMAGQLVTLYALGSVLAAIPVIVATRGWNRRVLFLVGIGGLFVFNTITALSTSYAVTLVARFVAGMAAGVVWGLFAGYVRRLVPPYLLGRALAVAGVGQPVALAVGVPLGTWLGTLFGWQGVFWIMSAVALLLLIWIRFGIPDFAGQAAGQRVPLRQVVMLPGLRSVLMALFAWILAHNTLYTYVSPFLASAGLGQRVDAVLLLFGVLAIVGIWLTGLLVDRHARRLTLVSLMVFAVATVLMGSAGQTSVVVLFGVVAWGLTFGGSPVLLQTALMEAAGDSADVAQSLFVTAFNLAVAGGGVVGGVWLNWYDAASLPWASLVQCLAALAIVWFASAHGFRAVRREASA